jgi:hypothetical protein
MGSRWFIEYSTVDIREKGVSRESRAQQLSGQLCPRNVATKQSNKTLARENEPLLLILVSHL